MKTSGIKILAVSAVLLTMASALAWQPEVLYGFPLGPGNPSSLVQGSDGSFYGTTTEGGIAGKGTVFKVTTNGVFTTLVSFTGPNGANPQASLVLGNDGNFYGTTSEGGPRGGGTIFRLVMPRFNNVVKQPDGSLLFNGVGPANEGFRVWSAPSVSLAFSSWSLVTSNAFDGNGNFSYTDAGVATNSSRFYRLSVP